MQLHQLFDLDTIYNLKHYQTITIIPSLLPPLSSNRVIRPELPTVYVYDHCPFCVRVRLAMGMKNVKHLIHFLANDDVATPTGLVGKKIAPIFVSTIAE